MQKLMKAIHKNEKGFTLVELMVVVVIIGVLVAIAIPIYNTVTARAEERACEANLRILDGAIQMWVADEPTRDPANVNMGALVPNFVETEPTCPTLGGTYTFVVVDNTDPDNPVTTPQGRAICPEGHDYRN